MPENRKTVLDFEGTKVSIDGEFDTSKFGVADALKSLQEADFWKRLSWRDAWTHLSKNLQEGHPPTIAALVLTAVVGSWVAYSIFSSLRGSEGDQDRKKKNKGIPGLDDVDEVEPIVLRDFTVEQLREFTGDHGKPIYVALNRIVFDVTKAANYYGKEGGYHCFAGREASRAMAKYCFDEAELASTRVDDLSPFERSTLDDWFQKFRYYRCYPVVGKVSLPPTDLSLTVEDLKRYKGGRGDASAATAADPSSISNSSSPHHHHQHSHEKKKEETQEEEDEAEGKVVSVNGVKYRGVKVDNYGNIELPPGEDRVDPPIYVGINGKVVDVSYGGKDLYGPGGPYHIFAGIDASRALARMSFDPRDLTSRDLSDLTADQRKTLNEWEVKFVSTRKYPVVGRIVD